MWRLFDWTLLALALFHGLNGLRWIIDDYVRSPPGKRAAVKAVTLRRVGRPVRLRHPGHRHLRQLRSGRRRHSRWRASPARPRGASLGGRPRRSCRGHRPTCGGLARREGDLTGDLAARAPVHQRGGGEDAHRRQCQCPEDHGVRLRRRPPGCPGPAQSRSRRVGCRQRPGSARSRRSRSGGASLILRVLHWWAGDRRPPAGRTAR